MSIVTVAQGKIPRGFDDKAAKVFKVLNTVMSETTKAANGDGIEQRHLISAIMSATITELMHIDGCPPRVAVILVKAAESIMEVHEGAQAHDPVH